MPTESLIAPARLVMGTENEAPRPREHKARGRYIAFGPDGEIEFGLRYRADPRIPEHTQRRMEGCARVAPGHVAVSLPDDDLVLMVEVASGRVAHRARVPGAQKLWSAGDGELLVAQPDRRAFTKLDLASGRSDFVACPGLRPVHVARWGEDLLVVDGEGPGFWILSSGGVRTRVAVDLRLLVPTSAVPACPETFVMSDRDAHLVARIARDGDVLWRHGAFEDPSSDTDRLANPEHVCALGGGRFAVTDMRNSRIVILDAEGACVETLGSTENIGSTDGALWAPTATAPSDEGIVVADAGNGRLVERRLGRRDRTFWGDPIVESCLFHHPRSCTPLGAEILVADSYHNRLVRLSRAGEMVSKVEAALHRRLFWPRNTACVAGQVMFSDSRNRRIVRLADGGEHSFDLSAAGAPWPFLDPHSIRPAHGKLLVTDTDAASVYLADPAGRLLFVWGPRLPPGVPGREVDLVDVHDACFDLRHGIWIADTGNNRLVLVDARPILDGVPEGGEVVRTVENVGLAAPRSVETTPDGLLLVCDSDNHRIALLDPFGELLYGHGGRFGHALAHLAHPRQATIHGGRLLVADCINNRLLDLPLTSLRSPGGERPYRPASNA